MSDFAARPASNVTGQATTEQDPSAYLFSPERVFGQPIVDVDNSPGYLVTATPQRGEAPDNWAIAPARQLPGAIAQAPVESAANSQWILWPQNVNTIVLTIPNGGYIRSIWVPSVIFPIQISFGNTIGIPMYAITTTGGELVPVPWGTRVMTLSANSGSNNPLIYVYVTGDVLPPYKGAGVGSIVQPIYTGYDTSVLGTPHLVHYWPMSEAAGSPTVADNKGTLALTLQGGVTLGNKPLTKDNGTSALFDGTSGYMPISDVQWMTNNPADYAIEFFVLPLSTGTIFSSNDVVANSFGGPCLYLNASSEILYLRTDKFNGDDVSLGVGLSSSSPTYIAINCATVSPGVSYIDVYLNGNNVYHGSRPEAQDSTAPGMVMAMPNTGGGSIGQFARGYFSKLALYNAGVLTPQVIASRVAYLGAP